MPRESGQSPFCPVLVRDSNWPEQQHGIVISADIVTFNLVTASEDEVCVVTCDASFKKGAAGLGVTITWRAKTFTPNRKSSRNKASKVTLSHVVLFPVGRLREERTVA